MRFRVSISTLAMFSLLGAVAFVVVVMPFLPQVCEFCGVEELQGFPDPVILSESQLRSERNNKKKAADPEVHVGKVKYPKAQQESLPTQKPKRYAYVTLCTHDKFVPLVLVMVERLRKTGSLSVINRVLALTTAHLNPTSRELLEQSGVEIVEVEVLEKPKVPIENSKRVIRADRKFVFTKLRIWQLLQYDKLVYLDADTFALQRVDALFDVPITEGNIAASPFCDKNCVCLRTFNSGVMVLMPSTKTFDAMIQGFKELVWGGQGDQSYLNAFFKASDSVYYLSMMYNVGKNVPRCSMDMYMPRHFKIFHFAGNNYTHPHNHKWEEFTGVDGEKSSREQISFVKEKKRPNVVIKYYQKLWWDEYLLLGKRWASKGITLPLLGNE